MNFTQNSMAVGQFRSKSVVGSEEGVAKSQHSGFEPWTFIILGSRDIIPDIPLFL
jgi:hypothetical protein